MAAGDDTLPVDTFLKLGLSEKAATQTAGSKAGPVLLRYAEAAGVLESGCDARLGSVLLQLATTLPSSVEKYMTDFLPYVADGRISSSAQVGALQRHLKSLAKTSDAAFDVAVFEKATGVGITVTPEALTEGITGVIDGVRAELVEKRYTFPVFQLLHVIRQHDVLRWAEPKDAKEELDRQVLALLGPKTEADEAMRAAAKKGGKKGDKKKGGKGKGGKDKGGKKGKAAAAAGAADSKPAGEDGKFKARDLGDAKNSERLLAEHKQVTGGIVRTRFPPEPNGFLHVGHAKSMNLNFNLAFKALGLSPEQGETVFRYDDTNPEAESHEFIESQRDNVDWLGWKPVRVTYSSDYFDQLYAFAEQLINAGKAFVCHQTKADMEVSREFARNKNGDPNSPWRDRPVAESLREFRRMRDGCYSNGEATLRLKMDMHSPNPVMWDPVAYRIKFHPHPRTGDKWCIYPSYDFTHCIVDSLEHIDYSLCTLEFEVRRDSYYWLLKELDIWRPHVWEFSRLVIHGALLSKRKIIKLRNMGVVAGWDDPRLFTINGLRRRGYSPQAINRFCTDIGVTRTENTITLQKLEHFVRQDMNETGVRGFAVVDPLEVELTNVDAGQTQWLEAPLFPAEPAKGNRRMPLSRTIYIERADFRLEDSKKFFGLAPGKTVGLRYGGLLTCAEVVMEDAPAAAGAGGAEPRVAKLRCTYQAERTMRPKGNLHFVSSEAGKPAIRAEARLYNQLFTCEHPGERTGNYLDDINQDSLSVVEAFIEPSLVGLGVRTPIQFERVGFFVVDDDASADRMVFNRTVSLKESKDAKALK